MKSFVLVIGIFGLLTFVGAQAPIAPLTPIVGISAGGAAGGDLSGTYPNPLVAQIQGASVPASSSGICTNSSRQLVSCTTTGTGNVVLANSPTLNNLLLAGGLISEGTMFTVSGCGTAQFPTGGAEAGIFLVGTGASPCTFTFTINGATGATAPNGWNCWAFDTSNGVTLTMFSSSPTTCVMRGNAATNDIIRWSVIRGF
jgi:hypothetical protein